MLHRITIDDAFLLINQNPNIVIYDVRDINSYQVEHLQNAIHLGRENFSQTCEEMSAETPVLLYCFRGNTSQLIGQMFVQQGFQQVYSIDGGIEAWKEKYLLVK